MFLLARWLINAPWRKYICHLLRECRGNPLRWQVVVTLSHRQYANWPTAISCRHSFICLL